MRKRCALVLAVLTLLSGLALPGPSMAGEGDTLCDMPAPPDAKHVVLLLWRGPTRVEAGLRSFVAEHDLALKFTCLSAESRASEVPELVRRAKSMDPDLVYTWGTTTTRRTVGTYDDVDPATHITDTPVLFTMVSYPEGSRIVRDLENHRAGITGATHTVPLKAQVRAMQAYRPIQRLAVLYNPLENNSVVNVRKLKRQAAESGFEILDMPVALGPDGRPDPDSIPVRIARLAAQEPQFLYIGPDSFIGRHRDIVIGEALRHGLPAFTSTELEILRGKAMIGLVTRYRNLGRYMGYLMKRVLIDGVAPENIPVSPLSRFTFALRLDIAKRLNLYPPLDVLRYAQIVDRPAR